MLDVIGETDEPMCPRVDLGVGRVRIKLDDLECGNGLKLKCMGLGCFDWTLC
jgi:hypothetical protein